MRTLCLLACALSVWGAEPSVADAKKFLDDANKRLFDLSLDMNQAQWIQSTYITDDTEAVEARANERGIAEAVRLAKGAVRFDKVNLPADMRREINLLKNALVLAAPADPAKSGEVTRLASSLEGTYGKGKYCPEDQAGKSRPCMDIEAVTRVMANSTDPAELLDAWRGWHRISPPMRKKFGDVVPANGPIPADLLGNIWAQDWGNIYKLVAPEEADKGYDLTEILKKRDTKPLDMVHYGENFFKSLGFAPLPATFWERSMFVKPRDRDVVCHASAWDIDSIEDLRIKMCIDITEEDFTTIHHELGHNFYQRAYDKQPFLFRDSANDGFHEAIGDTIALSVTPEYLVKIGLLDKAPDASKDIGLLLARALEKVAFLPFGLMIDQWRWQVFSGEIPPDQYNKAWWDLRLKYQGVAPPVARSERDFDPGAKYHVAADVPYTRYFLSYIMQFQFHRALAAAAGCPGNSSTPLNRCSIYNNKDAGKTLDTMLAICLLY